MKKKFYKFEDMPYMLAYPEGYKEGDVCPILFLIHGAGTRGTDPSILDDKVFFDCVEKMEYFPFIVVSPLCYANTWFDIYESLKRFVLFVANSEYADKNRIYGMGASMGGYTLWQLGMSMPEVFAAIAPICGGGMYWNAERLKNVPVWAFHGAKDNVVYPDESQKMVDKVNECGGNARLTICPEIAHNAWDEAYSSCELYKWFMSHENKNELELHDKYTDQTLYG